MLIDAERMLVRLIQSGRARTHANDVLDFLDGKGCPLASEARIATLVDMRAPIVDEPDQPVSLPELGWPFAAMEPTAPAPAPAPAPAVVSNAAPQPLSVPPPPAPANRSMRWLPWALLPLAFIAGLVLFELRHEHTVSPATDAVPASTNTQTKQPESSQPTQAPTPPAKIQPPAPSEAPTGEAPAVPKPTVSGSQAETAVKPNRRAIEHKKNRQKTIHGHVVTEYPLH